MTGQQPAQELLEVLRRPLAAEGFDLEDVEISTAGRRRLVRVLVDRDGGVTLDQVATATTLISDVLDEREPLGDNPYTLEVTSPGVERPLTEPRHWRRNVSRLVVVTGVDGTRTSGRILSGGDTAATLDVDGTIVELPYGDVRTARVEVEFNRAGRKEGARRQHRRPDDARRQDRRRRKHDSAQTRDAEAVGTAGTGAGTSIDGSRTDTDGEAEE